MTATPSRSDEFHTDNLTLATYLIMHGETADLRKAGEGPNGRPLGQWVFDDDEVVREKVGEFEMGKARVEPKTFHNMVAEVRREMFNFLGVNTGS